MNKAVRRRSSDQSAAPVMEGLETRQLLSGLVAVAVTSGAMTITGDSAANEITITDTGVGTFTVTGGSDTQVSYGGTTYDAGEDAEITGATKNVTIAMSQGGGDTIIAGSDLVLTDTDGAYYSLTFTGSSGDDFLLQPTAATGYIELIDSAEGDCAAGSVTITDGAPVAATGEITFVSKPKSGDAITISDGAGNSRTFTAKAAAATDAQFTIGVDKAATMVNLVAAINHLHTVHDTLDITATDEGSGVCSLVNANTGVAGNRNIFISSIARTRITAVGMSGGGTSNAADGDTVLLDDGINTAVTFTFGDGEGEVAVGTSAAVSALNLVNAINAVGDELRITASNDGDGGITLTQDVAGTEGNTTITVSGDELAKANFAAGTDGTNVVADDTITVDDGVNAPVVLTAAAAPAAHKFVVCGDAIRTMANLVAAINAEGIGITAVDNLDGSCELTNAYTGSTGDQELATDSANVFVAGMYGGTGYGVQCLNFTATMGEGDNFVGIGASGAGQSLILGSTTITNGTGDDTVEIYGASFNDNVTLTMGAGADTVAIADDGTYSVLVGGNLTVTQTDGDSAISLVDTIDVLTIGGNLSVSVGNDAGLTATSTLDNVTIAGTFSYTGGADGDTLELLSGVTVGDATTINLGAGANTVTADAGLDVAATTGGAFSYTGLAGADSITLTGVIAFGGATTFALGEGNNGLTIANGTVDGAFSATAGAGNDTLTLGATDFTATGALSVSPGAGTNGLTIDNADVVGFSYTGLGGADTLTLGDDDFTDRGAFTVAAGDGANALTMDNGAITGAVSYTGGAGADTVTVGVDAFTAKTTVAVTGGAGANAVAFDGSSKTFTYTGGANADALTLGARVASNGYALTGDLVVVGGAGANTLSFDGAIRNLTYTGGADADSLNLGVGGEETFLARGNVTITGAAGANALTWKNATVKGTVTYTGGAGVDTINIGQGADPGLTALKSATFSLAEGVDILNLDNSDFSKNSGSFSLNSGAGADQINVDVNAASATYFRRAVAINSASSADLFTDRAVLVAAGTRYLGYTSSIKTVFTGFLAGTGAGQINGAVNGTVNGDYLILPTVA